MKHRSSAGKVPPGQRQLRVGERIRHILADVLRKEHLRDPILEKSSLITVTMVDIGPDLKNATAYVMPLGGRNADAIVDALNKASGYFRSEVGPELDLRYTPRISFRLDTSFDEADRLERLLGQEKVQRDIHRAETESDEETTEDEE